MFVKFCAQTSDLLTLELHEPLHLLKLLGIAHSLRKLLLCMLSLQHAVHFLDAITASTCTVGAEKHQEAATPFRHLPLGMPGLP